MNIGFWMCIILVPFFGGMALIFYFGKEHAANLLSGFNAMPEWERMRYDRAWIARDTARDFGIWTGVMAAGALASWLISSHAAIFAYIVWLGLCFKDFHLDARKAYKKYLLK